MTRGYPTIASTILILLVVFGASGCTPEAREQSPVTLVSSLPTEHELDSSAWTVEDGLSGALIVETDISPDGSQVAHTVMRAHLAADLNEWSSQIHVAGPRGENAWEVGEDAGAVSSPQWSPDGSLLAFLATGADGVKQVCAAAVGGATVETLTAVPSGVAEFGWSPDGDRLALLIIDPEASEIGTGGPGDDAMVEGATTRVNLWTVAAEPGSPSRQLTRGDYRIESFDWSPDGGSIAFAYADASESDGWHEDIAVVDTRDGAVTPLATTEAAETGPIFSPDGSTIAYSRGETPTADFSAWRVVLSPTPGATGGISKVLAKTPNDRAMLFGWSPDGEHIMFEEALGTGHAIGVLPVSGAEARILETPAADVSAVSLSRDGTMLGFAMQGFKTPQEAYLAPVVLKGSLVPTSVSHQNDNVGEMRVPKMEILRWTSTDGIQVEGILTYPLDYEVGRRYPLVLSVHGGPAEKFSQSYFGQPDVYPYAVWASGGYAVLRANPRGSDGYGAEFRAANVADWDGGPYDDLMAGVDAVIEKGIADPERLCVVGWSYGGHMTANITTRTHRFKAAVVGAGPVNLTSQAGTSDLPDMIPAYMGGHPWERTEVYRRQSPVFAANRVKTPTLILHGTEDTRVSYSQAQEWHTALRAGGVDCELVAYPRSGHVVREPQLMRDLQTRTLAWVESRVK